MGTGKQTNQDALMYNRFNHDVKIFRMTIVWQNTIQHHIFTSCKLDNNVSTNKNEHAQCNINIISELILHSCLVINNKKSNLF